MAYISKEDVKQVRENLKKAFGKRFKFSVRRRDYMCVDVAIMEGDITDWTQYAETKPDSVLSKFDLEAQNYRLQDIRSGKFSVNHFWINENWKGEAKEIFTKMLECCQVGEGSYDRNAGDVGADYGDTTYFIELSVGRWDKPYKSIAPLDKVA
jgi:hypothetical protein